MKIDFKKERKELYQASSQPTKGNFALDLPLGYDEAGD